MAMGTVTWMLMLSLGAGPAKEWPGDDVPLPLAVRTPEDLAFKVVAERSYLEFNLMASGKLAYDRGDMATAADRFERLLSLKDLSPDVALVVRPLAEDARRRAGGSRVAAPEGSVPAQPQAPKPVLASVRGLIAGGGDLGPGGTVVWLTRTDAPSPRPRGVERTVFQRGKQFIPRILAVPVGSTVHFRNDDEVFHNVFSLTRPNDFDLGLYRSGESRDKTFRTPGPVNLLCNIHSSMVGYVYVVDTPYYAQADASGSWSVRNVPFGEYQLRAWHESSVEPVKRSISVKAETVNVPQLTVNSDRPPVTFVPDKAGKPRQTQLGY
jgi:plastocyanin